MIAILPSTKYKYEISLRSVSLLLLSVNAGQNYECTGLLHLYFLPVTMTQFTWTYLYIFIYDVHGGMFHPNAL